MKNQKFKYFSSKMKDLKVAMGEKIIWTIILSAVILVTTLLSAEFVDYSYPLLTKNINKT